MVLCLPLLLFVMALMINFGTAASWKVRALSIAREQAFSSRWPRTGGSNPRPAYWPAAASGGVSDVGNIQQLDDPRVHQPVVRGPLIKGAMVKADVLDPTRGLREGTSAIERSFPLLKKLGKYELHASTYLLDDKWQYLRMGLPSTIYRRIPFLYELFQAEGVRTGYVAAARNVYHAPLKTQLKPLDQDDEFAYYRQLLFGYSSSPDFHPRLSTFCSVDPELAKERTQDLVDHIQGRLDRDLQGNVIKSVPNLAQTMAQAFLDLYNQVISQGEAQIKASQTAIKAMQKQLADPKADLSADARAELQAQIARLTARIPLLRAAIAAVRPKIPPMSDFLKMLNGSEGKGGG